MDGHWLTLHTGAVLTCNEYHGIEKIMFLSINCKFWQTIMIRSSRALIRACAFPEKGYKY